jgi:hypothetical protein
MKAYSMKRSHFLSSATVYVAICTLAAMLVGVSIRAKADARSLAQTETLSPAGQIPAMIESRLNALQKDLHLNTEQQAMFLSARQATVQCLANIQTERQRLISAVKIAMEQDRPDLAALAAERDRIETANRSSRQAARAEWLKLYASFTQEQVNVIKTHVKPIIGKVEILQQLLPQIAVNSL